MGPSCVQAWTHMEPLFVQAGAMKAQLLLAYYSLHMCDTIKVMFTCSCSLFSYGCTPLFF